MTEYWVKQLETWRDTGTFEKLEEAKQNGTKVKVKRSDGSISIGVINEFGHGGRGIEIKIDNDPPLFKYVHTDKFLDLNPEFGPSLLHLVPDEEK